MDMNEFTRRLKVMAEKMPAELDKIHQDVESLALRFIDDNFINQGWEGQPWKATKRGGTILVGSGTLKSGFSSEVSQGTIYIRNFVKYANPHNRGFKGTVAIPEHTRGVYTGSRSKRKKKGTVDVRAHTRNMNLDQRQFVPTPESPSPTFNRMKRELITEQLNAHLKNLK